MNKRSGRTTIMHMGINRMTSYRVFLGLMCFVVFSSADEDDKKCIKMEDRPDLRYTTLRKQLLCNYDKHTAPVNSSDDNLVTIHAMLRYRLHYEQSEEWKSFDTYNLLENSPNWFRISAYVFVEWKDPRLQWNASEHYNITNLHFESDEIWRPDVDLGAHGREMYAADNDGYITYFFWTKLIGNCWPIYYSWGDRRECVLSFRINNDEAKLKRADGEEIFDTDVLIRHSASWSVVKAERVFPLKKGEKNEKFERIHKEKNWKYGPRYFEDKFIIQRNFAIQDATIFAPAAVLVILVIATTWIPAQNISRVAMLSVIVVVQVFMFHQSCRSMPFLPEKLVDIVRLYEELLICTGVAVLEWLIAYTVATQSRLAEKIETHIMPKPSIFTLLKTVFGIPQQESRRIEMAALLDRMTFLVLSVISFILVVLATRPPLIREEEEED